LLELLVVIAIITILMMFLFNAILGSGVKAKRAGTKALIERSELGIQNYHALSNSKYPASIDIYDGDAPGALDELGLEFPGWVNNPTPPPLQAL